MTLPAAEPTGRPSPITRPLGAGDPAWEALPEAIRQHLGPELDEDPVFWILPTRSRADVGGWTGPRRIFALVRRDRLSILAWGPRPFQTDLPFEDLRDSLFNHVTGAVDLAPAPDSPVTELRCAPPEGAQLLAHLHLEEPVHA